MWFTIQQQQLNRKLIVQLEWIYEDEEIKTVSLPLK